MAVGVGARTALHRLKSTPKRISTVSVPKYQSPSAKSNALFPIPPKFSPQSQYRKQIAVANLLQRYGFPPSQLHNFVMKNQFLLSSNLQEIEKSLGILLSFRIPQKSLISLISRCPGVLELEFLKKWEMGILEFGDLSVSPLTIRNVLEQSRRFQVDPNGFFRSVKVLKTLGFSDGTVTRVLEGLPRLIMVKESEISRKIQFLMELGIPKDRIEGVFASFPGILGFGIEDRLQPLLEELLDLGFSKDDVRKEIVREPRILGMELGEFSRCLEWLRTLKCRVPILDQIFGHGDFSAVFEVKLRVDCLCNHGLIRREAFEVLWKEPRLIIYEIEDIEKKIDFLVHRMKYSTRCLVDVPEYLGVNFEKQILPRYNVIEYLRSIGGLGCEVGLKGLVKPSRLRFYNLFVKPYPECEKMYGRFSGDVGVKSRHPIGLWKSFRPPRYQESKEDVENMKSFMESLV